jgi:hypothetical protein
MKTQITPELAQLWIDEATLARELGAMRPIRDWWVSYLAREMLKGQFSQSAMIGIGRLRGREGILNGNHTLRAIVRSGVTLTLPVETYDCETEAEFRHLYATWDTGQNRKRSDSLRAYDAIQMFGHGEQVAQADVGNLSSAVAFMLKGFGDKPGSDPNARPSNAELMVEMRPWVGPYAVLRSITGGGNTDSWNARILRRQGVCSVALITLRDQPELAQKFWRAVVSGVLVRENDPALRLRDYLMTSSVRGGAARQKNSESGYRMARTVDYCWGKFYLGKTIKSMHVNMERPPELLGCLGVRRPDTLPLAMPRSKKRAQAAFGL